MIRISVVAIATSILLIAINSVAAPAAKSNPGRGKAIDLITEGRTLERNGDKQGAFGKYLESARTAPSPLAYYHLGRLSRASGDRDSARRYLQQALDINPDYEMAKLEMQQIRNGSTKSDQVKAVAQTLPGSLEPGGAISQAEGSINIDGLRREYVTMQSLEKPLVANSDPVVALPNTKNPQPSEPTGVAPEPGYAKRSAEPPAAGVIVNESHPRIISNKSNPAVIANGKAGGSDSDSTANAPQEDTLDAAAINEAAFGEESQKDPGSKVYGQQTQVALGTFAFHREKADTYRKSGRWKEAAVEYELALELKPNDAETRTLLAEVLGRHGSSAAAQEEFEVAEKEAPNDSRVHYKRANAYYDQQKLDLAIGSYLKSIELDPANKFAVNNLGVVYMEKGEYNKAVSRFQRVLQIDPKYDMAVLNLGIIYDEHLADKEQAAKYYKQYLDLDGPRKSEVGRWLDAIEKKP